MWGGFTVNTEESARRLPEGGFTLIEVLIAMVILAVGLLGLEALGIGAARAVVRADQRTEYTSIATAYLESSMQQIRNGAAAPATGQAVVTPISGGPGAGEPLTITRTVVQVPNTTRAYQVTIQVSPSTTGSSRSPVSLSSTVFW